MIPIVITNMLCFELCLLNFIFTIAIEINKLNTKLKIYEPKF